MRLLAVVMSVSVVAGAGGWAQTQRTTPEPKTAPAPVSVSTAIDKGAQWLASVQGADGGWGQDGGQASSARPGERLDLSTARTLPKAYVHVSVNVVRRPEVCAVSYRLSLKRACLFERDVGLDQEPAVLDDGSQPAVVWERGGFLTGAETEIQERLLAALRGRVAELARALELANRRPQP